MPDHTHIADLLSASGVPVTVEADRDHLVLSVGGLSAVFGLGQQDELMQAIIAAWLEAERWGPEVAGQETEPPRMTLVRGLREEAR